MATMKYLIKAGIDADRFRLSQAGPNEPQTISRGGEKQTMNSCVDVIVLPELADDLFRLARRACGLGTRPMIWTILTGLATGPHFDRL